MRLTRAARFDINRNILDSGFWFDPEDDEFKHPDHPGVGVDIASHRGHFVCYDIFKFLVDVDKWRQKGGLVCEFVLKAQTQPPGVPESNGDLDWKKLNWNKIDYLKTSPE
jgi:hypothetical protein